VNIDSISFLFRCSLKVCREADPTSDMNKLIDKKLIKYYETVHPDFVNSKSFVKNVTAVTIEIRAAPSLVYLKLANILEELNIRRKSGSTVISNEEVTTTGDMKKDKQIKRLNKALYILKRRIAKLEEAEVDFDNENQSAYVLVERYKKRACEIYEKICEITGESKHAQRIVKKPIKFNGTGYTEFNKTMEKFVNQTNTFPDFFDVMRCMEHCNSQYGYKLRLDEMKKIGQDAFMKIGKLLQNRRRTDLYEVSGSDGDSFLLN
jgi:death-associated protein 6